jgi:intracellular sulfur oxidation DsrE/DsrF family protein
MSTRNSYKSALLSLGLLMMAFAGLSTTSVAYADNEDSSSNSNIACPAGYVKGLPLDEEFGPGTSDLTRCLSERHNVKLLVQINQYCARTAADGSCSRAYALHNIDNVIADYETTYGMKAGRDYEIAAIVHSGGGSLVVKDGVNGKNVNEFEGQVQDLMNKGVKFYFCMNTTRGMKAAGKFNDTGDLVTSMDANGVTHSVGYVTAGITALADFQARGYTYVQP